MRLSGWGWWLNHQDEETKEVKVYGKKQKCHKNTIIFNKRENYFFEKILLASIAEIIWKHIKTRISSFSEPRLHFPPVSLLFTFYWFFVIRIEMRWEEERRKCYYAVIHEYIAFTFILSLSSLHPSPPVLMYFFIKRLITHKLENNKENCLPAQTYKPLTISQSLFQF